MTRPTEADRDIALAPLLLKLRARDRVSDEEEAILRDSIATIREVPRGKVLVRSGVELGECTLLFGGIVARYKDLADGQRQIMELHVTGDFLDLHSYLLKRLEHVVGSMTEVRIATVPHEAIRLITETQPHLTRLLWFSTLVDASIHREKILSVGRRSALARIGHHFCEMKVRLAVVGMGGDAGYRHPLTQIDIADVTGLTPIHVNRMLKQLRDQRLMTFRGGEVEIHDWQGLARVAEFDPAYLYAEHHPL